MQPDNPYSAPQVELVDAAPQLQLSGWSARQLQMFGGLALMSALVVVVMTGLIVAGAWLTESDAQHVEVFIRWLSLLWVLLSNYLLIRFKGFVEQRFGARGLFWPIWAIIALGLVLGLLDFLMGDQLFLAADALTIGYLGLLVVMGGFTAWAGVRLLKVEQPYPALRVMAWLYLASGLMLASVLLMLPAILTLLAASVAQALVFFRAAGEMRASE